jgi:hypothetical protein
MTQPPSRAAGISWPAAEAEIGTLLDIDATARSCNAFRRPRGVRSARDLLRLALSYGAGTSLREGSAWARATEMAAVSAPALHRRLGNAADWLELIAQRLVEDAQEQPGGRWAGWRLRLVDATSVCHPGADRASWRVHVRYGLSGRIEGLAVTDDKGAEHLTRFSWRPGDIAIADRGYAKPKDLRPVVEAGAHLVVRVGWNSLRLLAPDAGPFDLFAAMDEVGQRAAAHAIRVDTREPGRPYLPARLIIGRLPEGEAAIAREKVKARASKAGKVVDERSLTAAGFVMVLTSLPPDHRPADILALYRCRWQIELLFKRFKSLLDLGELPAKKAATARAWIYAKLILALLTEKAARRLAEAFP